MDSAAPSLCKKGLSSMRTRIFFAIVAAITLAGCSGGGANGTLPNPGSGTTQPMSQQEQAQTGVDSAMSEIERGALDSTLFSGSVGVTLSSAIARSISKATAP